MNPTAGPTEELKKEGILCKSSWEAYCSLVVRLQDISVKGWPFYRDLVPLQWPLSKSWCLFSPSSFVSELLASKDVGLKGCLEIKCPWSSLDHGTTEWFGLEGTSGGPYLIFCSPEGRLWDQASLLGAAYGLLDISLLYPGIARSPVLAFDIQGSVVPCMARSKAGWPSNPAAAILPDCWGCRSCAAKLGCPQFSRYFSPNRIIFAFFPLLLSSKRDFLSLPLLPSLYIAEIKWYPNRCSLLGWNTQGACDWLLSFQDVGKMVVGAQGQILQNNKWFSHLFLLKHQGMSLKLANSFLQDFIDTKIFLGFRIW